MSLDKNFHSILTGQYFIHEQYGKGLLPSLFNLINGKQPDAISEARKPVHLQAGRTGSPVAAKGAPSGGQSEYVLIMDLKDPIYKYNQYCGPEGTKQKMRILEMYKNDPACKGVVLDIDSGGGQVSGTPEFYDYLVEFGKPVVAYTDGYMCSAAYYIGSATNYIVANKRADHIGSIGVMVYFIDVTGMYEAQGAKVISEKSDLSPEKNKDFDELVEGKPENYIKNQLNPLAKQFHEDMKAVRPTLKEETLKGGTWNAKDSLELGLIDEIGTLRTAIDKVFELAEESSNNQNLDNMSKSRPAIEAVLGLTAALAETDNGSYLNATQLDTIEADLQTAKDNAGTLQTQLDTANTNLQTTTTAATETETAINALATAAGIEVKGTATEKLASLGEHYKAINEADGDKATNPKTDANSDITASSTVVGNIDIADSMNY